MSMYLEVFSKIWKVWGDGHTSTSTFNMAGYPFNLALAQMPRIELFGYCVNAKGTIQYPLTCTLNGTIGTLTWPAPVKAGESTLIRLTGRIVMDFHAGDTFLGVFTATVADDRILVANHGLLNGDQVKFALDDPATCALPTPLNEINYYYVVNVRGNDFMVSSTSGGAVINITDKGVGSNTVWKRVS